MPSSGSGSATSVVGTADLILSLVPTNNVVQIVVGDTQQITHTETGVLSWTVMSSSIEITTPTGSVISATPGIVNNTSALSQTLTYGFTPTTAGIYKIRWTFTASDGETYDRVEYWTVNWTDVYNFVRTLLQRTAATQPQYEVSIQFTIAAKLFALSYPTLPAYSELSGEDQFLYDTGIGYLTAARLGKFKASMAPKGSLTGIKEQTSEFTFSAPVQTPERMSDDLDVGSFTDEGVKLLRRISTIKAIYDNLRTGPNMFHVFVLDGPSRASINNGRHPSLYSIVANMLATHVDFGATFDWNYWGSF